MHIFFVFIALKFDCQIVHDFTAAVSKPMLLSDFSATEAALTQFAAATLLQVVGLGVHVKGNTRREGTVTVHTVIG